ncbi:MAG: glycosyltransferase family 4 protein [Thiomargarita sp.]|nr:glycosyltransferase family 4 protein [Thiomargarita sp.]
MKITFVLPVVNMSGGIRVVAIYADLLKKRGHEVFVVSTPKRRPNLRKQMRSLRQGKGWVSVTKNNPSHFDNVDVPHHVINRFRPVTNADVPDADVVIATWWETAEWVAKLSEAKGAKTYFLQHHELHSYLPKERVEATWSLPMHKITISKWLVDLARTYGDSNVSHVPNSVDTEQFYAPRREKQAIPTVGMMYSTANWKGCDISLKAFSLAAQNIPNLRLVAFGNQRPSSNLLLPPCTEYVYQPPQNTIKDIYAKCDVWLCGSWSEGFHLPPLEAMACRCPVVSTQVGGPMDIIKDGVNGYLVKTGDSTALANQLIRVLTFSNDKWQIMSDAVYTTAIRYTWDDATELFETALYTAIERWQRGDLSGSDR